MTYIELMVTSLLTKNNKYLIAVFLLFACLIVLAENKKDKLAQANGTLVGDVADKFEGVPIPRAYVFIHGTGGNPSMVVELDAVGRFSVLLPPGVYDVFVAAVGFAPTCKAVSIVGGQMSHFQPRLEADREHMEE